MLLGVAWSLAPNTQQQIMEMYKKTIRWGNSLNTGDTITVFIVLIMETHHDKTDAVDQEIRSRREISKDPTFIQNLRVKIVYQALARSLSCRKPARVGRESEY